MIRSKPQRDVNMTRLFSAQELSMDPTTYGLTLRLVGEKLPEPPREASPETKAIMDRIFGSGGLR